MIQLYRQLRFFKLRIQYNFLRLLYLQHLQPHPEMVGDEVVVDEVTCGQIWEFVDDEKDVVEENAVDENEEIDNDRDEVTEG
ncbi:hypothetical protein AYI70_g5173 [Smittium culicis]|uniref:Uncharacterized protein n=1 Tax=Smittium culicis TaxID=133412 RepID=A0A1R1XW32_9FUNG|nr:hypothetical protein AYI70_g5173 [Smittium culicis]